MDAHGRREIKWQNTAILLPKAVGDHCTPIGTSAVRVLGRGARLVASANAPWRLWPWAKE